MDIVPSLSVSIASKFFAAFLLNFFASLRSSVPSWSLSALLNAAAVLSWFCMLLSLVFLSCLASLLVSFIASLVLGSEDRDCEVSACLGAALTSSGELSAAKTTVAVPAKSPATNTEIMERFILMLLSGNVKTRSSDWWPRAAYTRLFGYLYATIEISKSYARSHGIPP